MVDLNPESWGEHVRKFEGAVKDKNSSNIWRLLNAENKDAAHGVPRGVKIDFRKDALIKHVTGLVFWWKQVFVEDDPVDTTKFSRPSKANTDFKKTWDEAHAM
eukprot:Filipodium_phascolosomae@DN8413_c0_g1_i1.p2